ncbi:secondary thiamine-phosphate synthase enzyme YjbQ [Chloroflexota bacterium]
MLHRLIINTRAQVDLQDITSEVKKVVNSSGVQSGVCYLFVTHTTAGVTVNEHADPSVAEDVSGQLDVLIPQHRHYRHGEGNSPAHIKAILVGSSETLLIEDGQLVLGTWQGIFFCEFDGPRNRSLLIKIIADNP